MDKIIHLLLQDILNFHSDLERQFVLLPGIRNIGLLESAISTAFQSFGGYDLYPTVHEKAAQLCRGIAKNHPFIDGNKRTALHCLLILERSFYGNRDWTSWYGYGGSGS